MKTKQAPISHADRPASPRRVQLAIAIVAFAAAALAGCDRRDGTASSSSSKPAASAASR